MPPNFPTPERCLLVQAAHWFIDGTMPIPDEVYRRAPVELKADNAELRELFLALHAEDCDLRGELVVEYTNELGRHDPEDFDYSPPMTLLRDAQISIIGFLEDVDFANSIIRTKSWKVDEISDEQIEKKRQSFPSDEGWKEIGRSHV